MKHSLVVSNILHFKQPTAFLQGYLNCTCGLFISHCNASVCGEKLLKYLTTVFKTITERYFKYGIQLVKQEYDRT